MKQTIRYSGPNADAQALSDVAEYLGPTRWSFFEETYFGFDEGDRISLSLAKQWIRSIRLACAIAGIEGFPVRALCRVFLAQFRSRA